LVSSAVTATISNFAVEDLELVPGLADKKKFEKLAKLPKLRGSKAVVYTLV
jgi:hypothetical protein